MTPAVARWLRVGLETRQGFSGRFSKKNIGSEDFFLKKEAKTFICSACMAWLARAAHE
jgi:hypothetical protein